MGPSLAMTDKVAFLPSTCLHVSGIPGFPGISSILSAPKVLGIPGVQHMLEG